MTQSKDLVLPEDGDQGKGKGEVTPARGGFVGKAKTPMPVMPRRTVGSRAELVQAFVDIVSLIPSEEVDGMDAILTQIMNAQSLDDIFKPWESAGGAALEGVPLELDVIECKRSSFADGLGFFAFCEGTRMDTGERITVTTGSQAVVFQLAKAWSLGEWPLKCRFRLTDPNPETGYRAQYLARI